MISLFFILTFLIGISIGGRAQKILTERLIKLEHEKMNLAKKNDYVEIISKIKSGKSEFKTRVNDTVYVGVDLAEHGEVDVIYLMDKQDIAIFQGSKCIHTSDGIQKEIIGELISLIFKIYNKKINDVVEVLGFVFYREEFERSFNMKLDDIKKSPLFSNLKQEVNEIDKINIENQKRFDIDEILDKISSLGIHSLTIEERLFLDNYSNEKGN
jgi:hypothetical protein